MKDSLRYLNMNAMTLSRYAFDCMAPFLSLLILDLRHTDFAHPYFFPNLHLTFPSLTSLTLPHDSDQVIRNIIKLPALEEMQFVDYAGEWWVTAEEFALFAEAAPHLRAIGWVDEGESRAQSPTLATLTPLFALTHLVRLTIPVRWMRDEVCEHFFAPPPRVRFPALRCLQLELESGLGPLSDAGLRFFVKHSSIIVKGRAERQAKRRAPGDVRPPAPEGDEESKVDWAEVDAAYTRLTFPFPALECLHLHQQQNNTEPAGAALRSVSARMRAELRRCYEFEAVEEWEAEVKTLGRAEWFKEERWYGS